VQLNIADDDPDIKAAFLVVRPAVAEPRCSRTAPALQRALIMRLAINQGRCLGEVECGKCPPRCATLQSTKRTPQVCALSGAPARCLYHERHLTQQDPLSLWDACRKSQNARV
jgi:hypothetical protein